MNMTSNDTEALFNRLWESVPADAPSPEQLRAEHGPLLRQIREALADGFAAQRADAPMVRYKGKTNDAREVIAATLLQNSIHRACHAKEPITKIVPNPMQADTRTYGDTAYETPG